MMQRSAHKEAKRRGFNGASPQSHPDTRELIRAWIRLWLPILVLLIVLGGFASFAFGAPASRVTVSAQVRPTFKLSIDEGVVAVSSNVPWTVALWRRGELANLSGGPTAYTRISSTVGGDCVTFVGDDVASR